MNRYDRAFTIAEFLRKIDCNTAAIFFYALAENDPARSRAAIHMSGVCYVSLGKTRIGLSRFQDAFGAMEIDFTATEEDRRARQRVNAQILRDRAKAYAMIKLFNLAHHDLDNSMNKFKELGLTDECAMSLGFLGRVYLQQDENAAACRCLREADDQLSQGGNRHYECYNLPYYIEALRRNDELRWARVHARRYMHLALRYGGPKRWVQAWRLCYQVRAPLGYWLPALSWRPVGRPSGWRKSRR